MMICTTVQEVLHELALSFIFSAILQFILLLTWKQSNSHLAVNTQPTNPRLTLVMRPVYFSFWEEMTSRPSTCERWLTVSAVCV